VQALPAASARHAAVRLGTALAFAAAFVAVLAVRDAAAARLDPVGTFDRPTYATSAPGDDRRLFVVEREGTIRVMVDGRTVGRPFLRIPGGVSSEGERGFMSMAFSPRYRRNGLFYVFYTTPGGGDLRVDEFRRDPHTANRARRSSRRRVIQVEHSQDDSHNGGQLQFGPDGRLYISTGDGGGAGDPERNGQDIHSLLGKILRIDPSRAGRRSFTVPRGNPFFGRSGRDPIFALGLRNPFRFSFDRVTGALAIGDVGQDAREEVNYRVRGQAPGPNFGWNCFEGTSRFRQGCRISYGRHVKPVIQHRHSQGHCSVIGGYVARHASLGSLRGRYVYGDLCTGVLRSATLRVGGARGDRRVPGARLPSRSLVSFGEGVGGRLYVVSRDGPVFQLRD
jgi:hypothetical protein